MSHVTDDVSDVLHSNGAEPATVQITNQDLIAVHTSMLEGLSQLADYFGFNKVMGQLYGALLLSDEPLSLDDLMDTLSISKASVSMNVRTLEHMGMVRQVWVHGKGGRRKYYEAETDFLQIISTILSGREMRDVGRALSIMDENIERLNKALPNMNATEQQFAKVYTERITYMQTMFQFAQVLIGGLLASLKDLDVSDITKIQLR
ncbi:MAG: helix-turn-helix domain-containing protein [Armatimonadetes bacterium]|nr:helix-turn-helix domain-containing protein [Anaerolineae bacterium]